ncbi:phosphonate C-P lyase system protein PhnG [Anaerorhabdus sp.]|jgi:alpha-D-ribose 1-methylphosphonate 5-triphosphate synthase subunit PhnG|uniref:phosphonate C-P lyase system protein PhnG n=1 Tax=Anaerorhabdus sp. TaxID=1872524 RepID=UPI002FCA05CD
MNRKERTEVLINMNIGLLRSLAKKINEQHDVKEIESPSHSLVMIKKREGAKNSLFYLSEVVVSECRVMIDNHIGFGILQGFDLKKAKLLAIVDAAFNANSSLCYKLEKTIEVEKQKQELKQRQEMKAILKTKVSFDTMQED